MSSSSISSPRIVADADNEDDHVTVEVTVEESAAPIQLPSDPRVFLQAAQFTLLFVAALYLTRTIVLPIVLAILLKLLLQSGVRRLERIHVPRVLAALAMITVLFITLVSMGTALSGPAHDWVARL